MNKIGSRIIPMVIVVSIILSGCWDQRIFEQTGFIMQIGVDSSEKEDEMLLTYTAPVVGEGKKTEVEVMRTTSGLLRGARENLNRVSPRFLEAGKMQQILFSEEMAKKGLHNIFEILERDPLNPILCYVVVVEGSPGEMIEKAVTFKDKPIPALYINQLLENNVRSSYIPETRIYNFDIAYFAHGIDPITPLIRFSSNDIAVVGSALFKDDKMVGKIDHRKTSILLAIKNMMKHTEYICTIPSFGGSQEGEKHIAVMIKQSKSKVDVKIVDNKPVVNISLSFISTLDSYTWDNTSSPIIQKNIEDHIAMNIKRDAMETVKYLQKIGSDPIGIGDMVRAKYNTYWKSVDWEDAYKKAEINVDTKVGIVKTGAIW